MKILASSILVQYSEEIPALNDVKVLHYYWMAAILDSAHHG